MILNISKKRMIKCVCVTLRYINIRRQCHIPASYSIKHCQCVISYYLYNVSPSRKMKGWTLFIQIYPQGIDVQATLRPLIQKELFLQILSWREDWGLLQQTFFMMKKMFIILITINAPKLNIVLLSYWSNSRSAEDLVFVLSSKKLHLHNSAHLKIHVTSVVFC